MPKFVVELLLSSEIALVKDHRISVRFAVIRVFTIRSSIVPVLKPAFLIGADSKPTNLRDQEELDNKLGHFSV